MRRYVRQEPIRLRACANIGIAVLLIAFVGIPLLGTMPDDDGDGQLDTPSTASFRHTGCSDARSVDAVFVIDALRADVWRNASMFPRVEAMRQRGILWEHAFVAAAPTVTLPKLETIVRGRDGGFLDVLRNFMDDVGTVPEASRGEQRSYPRGTAVPCDHPSAVNDLMYALSCELPSSHAAARHRRVAFYGDDTWLRMYPCPPGRHDCVFVESEGVTSFDVHDATEVDDNVTRHLVRFLEHATRRDDDGATRIADADLIWMHFLGYDHIGHVEDPQTSVRVPKKLREMDHLIAVTVEGLCGVHPSATVTVLSDHGMAIGGGHGGASQEERSVTYARIGCAATPVASTTLLREEAAMDVAWPQVDVSQMLLLSLSRRGPPLDGVPTTLPRSLGVAPPSFVAAACGGGGVKNDGDVQQILSKFRAAKHQQSERMRSRGQTSGATKARYVCALCVLAVSALRCSTLSYTHPLVIWSFVEGMLLPLSSSFSEEMVFVRSSVAMLAVLLHWLRQRRDASCCSGRGMMPLTPLLCALVVIRLAATSIFSSGVKWKTLVALQDGSIWSRMVFAQWWEAHVSGQRLLGGDTVSLLWVLTAHPLESIALCGFVAVIVRVVQPVASIHPNVRREGLLLVLSTAAMPLTVPHLALSAGLYLALRWYFARGFAKDGLLAAVLLCECAFGAYGRSILVNDVFFAHLISSSVSRHSALLRFVGGVGLLMWHNTGRLVFMAAFTASAVQSRCTSLRDIVHACLLRAVLVVSGAAVVAIAMEGHLFYWSVFLPNLLFAQADLVFYVIMLAMTTTLPRGRACT